jgi:hypothetical protein
MLFYAHKNIAECPVFISEIFLKASKIRTPAMSEIDITLRRLALPENRLANDDLLF